MGDKDWLVHVEKVLSGKRISALELTFQSKFSNKRKRGFGLSQNADVNEVKHIVDKLLEELQEIRDDKKKDRVMEDFEKAAEIDRMITNLKSVTDGIDMYEAVIDQPKVMSVSGANSQRERDIVNLGLILIEAASWNDKEVADAYIDEGFPINFQHPRRNCTALHDAVRCSQTDFAESLMNSGKCDYLLKDNRDQTAYDVAYTKCSDIDLTDELRVKTEEQAKARGLNLDDVFSIEVV
ncbi:MAG: hypothetical protein ACRBDL_08820 [Alphaproteobacteria bacterium]